MFKKLGFTVAILFLAAIQIASAQEKVSLSEFDSLSKSVRQIQESESLYNQQTKLTASDGANDDNFGVSVAISGDTAVVGSWQDDVGANANQGSAYVFLRSSAGVWNLQQKLTASDGAAGDNFGYSVAITTVSAPNQSVIMVGAFGDDTGANANQGAVYVFVRNSGGTTWSQQGKLTASDGLANDVFGASVALSGSFAIIGANGVDIGANVSQGAAYIFVRSGTSWLEEQKLVQNANSGAAMESNFGWSVAISGTTAIVGTNYTQTSDGRIVIFDRVTGGNTWNVTAFSGTENNDKKFGYAVAISGDTAVVGALIADVGANNDQGEARVLNRVSATGWAYGATLRAADGRTGDNFGSSVGIMGDTIAVGAVGVDFGGIGERGAVYAFNRSGTTWSETQKLLDEQGGVGDFLGYSVAVSGDTVISGAWNDDVGALGQAGSASVFKFTPTATPFDFDGDGKTDIGIFRPAPGEWWIQRSSNSQTFALQFGTSTDKIVPADYTGDGKTDVAFWRPSNGNWFVLRSEDSTFYAFPFGANGDVPTPADYDADGKIDAAVFRPSNNTWFIQKSAGGTDIVGFGAADDKPVVGDYDGDNKADIAVFRPNAAGGAQWWIRRSSNLSVAAFQFGTSTDKAVQADYTGDGKTDVAFWRPSNGNWFILRSEDSTFYAFPFGANGDTPVAGDYDGDGKTDAGVFRPANQTWFVQKSSGGTIIQQFGISGDSPIPNAFVP